jgi:hypothetical protein
MLCGDMHQCHMLNDKQLKFVLLLHCVEFLGRYSSFLYEFSQ